jgi:heme exporter protein C
MGFKNSIIWLYFSSPKNFYPFAGKLIPWFGWLAAILTVVGLYIGFFVAPPVLSDQKEYYVIIFIHVPAAWMSMFIYVVMSMYAFIALVWNIKMSEMMATALAPTGAMFTFLALWTGALWGRPSWGAYWVWDARLTSELILLFLYIGFMSLQSAIDDPRRAARASGLLAVVGVINIPIIYFSVRWWNTLHQGFSVQPAQTQQLMDPSIKWGMLILALAFWMYTIAVVLCRVRTIILERERQTTWVQELVSSKS